MKTTVEEESKARGMSEEDVELALGITLPEEVMVALELARGDIRRVGVVLCAPHPGISEIYVAELPRAGTWGISPGFSGTLGDPVLLGTGLAAVASWCLAGALVPAGSGCPSPLATQERPSFSSWKPAAHSQTKPSESSRQLASSAHLPARRYLPGQGQSTAPEGIPSQRAPTWSAMQVAVTHCCPGQRALTSVPGGLKSSAALDSWKGAR